MLRPRLLGVIIFSFALAFPVRVVGQHSHGGGGGHSGSSHSGSSHSRSSTGSSHRSPSTSPKATTPATPGARDTHGRLKRSEEAKRDFEKESGHPHGWPGHVVDHVVPLACGGTDAPSNMQWQTTEEAKAKDKVERKGCASGRGH